MDRITAASWWAKLGVEECYFAFGGSYADKIQSH